jgi:hypothetical protein
MNRTPHSSIGLLHAEYGVEFLPEFVAGSGTGRSGDPGLFEEFL